MAASGNLEEESRAKISKDRGVV